MCLCVCVYVCESVCVCVCVCVSVNVGLTTQYTHEIETVMLCRETWSGVDRCSIASTG